MDRIIPRKYISRLFPEQDLLDELARKAAWSFACEGQTSHIFSERETADNEADELFLRIGGGGFSNEDELFGVGGKRVEEALERFEDEFWRNGHYFLNGPPAQVDRLTVTQLRRTHGVGREKYARTFTIKFNGSCLNFNHLITKPASQGGGMWEVIYDGMSKRGQHLMAMINLDLRFVGPWLYAWSGHFSGAGWNVLLAVLKASFGDSIGLRLLSRTASVLTG